MYRVATDTTQNYHVEGLPFGTRGGLVVEHEFPEDATYNFKIYSVNLGNMGNFRPFGEIRGEKLEVLVDGERVALVDWDEAFGLNKPGFGGFSGQLKTIDVKVPVSAGPHRVGVTFLATNYAPGLDMNRAFERSTIETGGLPGYTFYPHIGSVRIDGPYDASGAGDTPSRERILTCTPSATGRGTAVRREDPEDARAERAIAACRPTTTSRRCSRSTTRDARTVTSRAESRSPSSACSPIRSSSIAPSGSRRTTRRARAYRISDLELASRLSFFLWSSIPDDELLALAEQGKLADPAVLEKQVRRMLADPRSEALTANFAGQWLNLRALEGHVPVAALFPDFDDNLRQAFRRETELLFDSLIREDRPITDLLTADYTFVNERLAKHYGIPGIYGSHFRRVTLGPELDARRGLLGKGSLLATSSQPGRTSPVMRGNWVLQNLLGEPPPPPPPNVPVLKPVTVDATGNTQMPSMREQMELHRARSRVRGLPQADGPDRLRAREVRRGRHVAHDGRREHDRRVERDVRRHEDQRPGGSAQLRAALRGPVRAHRHGEAADLRARPRRRVLRHAGRAQHRARRARRTTTASTCLIVDVVKSAPFQMNSKPGQPVTSRAPPAAATTASARD